MKLTLEAARVNAGVDQAEAMKIANISKKTLYNWEKGICDPPIRKLLLLCERYGCSIDDITWN